MKTWNVGVMESWNVGQSRLKTLFHYSNAPVEKMFWLIFATLFALCLPVQAQQQAKIPKIGELVSRGRDRPGLGTGRELFRRSLRELGYVEGKSIAYETRSAEGKVARFPVLAEELVRVKVDVFVASSVEEAFAFKNATNTIPIVYVGPTDPVSIGLANSLARPGGNLTGFTTVAAALAPKRLELLKETVPNLSRVALLWNPRGRTDQQTWKEYQLAAQELGLQLHSMNVSSADGYEGAFKEAIRAGSAAISVRQTPPASSNQKLIVELAAKYRLPAIYDRRDFVESGGLMSYGSDEAEPYRRAAVMVDKILKGTKPADIPIEQPMKFEFIINLKAAKQIGLTIPPNVLVRAQRVIK
jgi:putative ABC transport system substrate-binding protein